MKRGCVRRGAGIRCREMSRFVADVRASNAQNEAISKESLATLVRKKTYKHASRRIFSLMCQNVPCSTDSTRIPTHAGNLTKSARFHRMPRECRTSFGSFLDFRSPYDRPATMARLATRVPSRPAHPIASLVTFSTRFTDNLFEGRTGDLYILPLPIRQAFKARLS